jgi:hypothetical protein
LKNFVLIQRFTPFKIWWLKVTEIIASSDFVKHSQSVNFKKPSQILIKFTIFIKRWLSGKKTTKPWNRVDNYLNTIRLTVRLSLISQLYIEIKKTVFRFVIKLIKVITKDYGFTRIPVITWWWLVYHFCTKKVSPTKTKITQNSTKWKILWLWKCC